MWGCNGPKGERHMNRKWIVAALAAVVAVPAPVLAQETPRPRRTPRAETRSWSFTTQHARIGVVVATRADEEKDKIGARIEAVTPGGPADDAGLKAGDIITKFNGTALGGVRAEDEDESGPGNKLVELAHALDPGDTVRVEYRRGSEAKTATIVAEDLDGRASTIFFPDMPDIRTPMPEMQMPRVQIAPFGGEGFTIFGSPWGGLEMVSLNPDLGEYFGTREGLLVVKTPRDSALQLKGGDVILAIDGRKPSSPSQAMRILGTYDVGDTVKIDVMRRQRRSTVTWIVPERGGLMPSRTPRARRPRGESGEQSFYRVQPTVRVLPFKVRSVIPLRVAKVSPLRFI